MVWYGVVWCGVVWYGMVWYGMYTMYTIHICVRTVRPNGLPFAGARPSLLAACHSSEGEVVTHELS